VNIQIKNTFKEYNGKCVLEIQELSFEKGYVYALMGLNGSGKTTLLQCASGLETFTKGEIFYNGHSHIAAVRKDITVMPQKPYLFNDSVIENIKLGLKFRKYGKEQIEKILVHYLKCFDIEHLLTKNAKKLSGGEQAKVALLRTAVLETEVTFLDEPTASMDIESTLKAEMLIKNMAAGKRTVIIVTHDLYQAERVADYVIFLDKGKVIEKGDKYKVFNAPKHKLVKQILGRNEENDKNSNFNYK
jgi:tungstate transport system ATP-binding protein